MATVDSRRSRKHYDEYEDEHPHHHRKKKKKKSHAFRNTFVVLFLLSGVVLYFAPVIVAKTPLLTSILQSAIKLDGSLHVGGASLGWFSPVTVDDIKIYDKADDTAIEITQIRTEKSLLGLLLDLGNVGRVEIDKVSVHAVCQEKVTNLEQLFAKLLADESESHFAADLHVNDGTVVIDDAVAARTFRIEKLTVHCKLADAEEPILLTASGTLVDKEQPGEFNVEVRTRRSADGKNPVAAGKVNCTATVVPLELADPLVRRYVAEAQLGGHLSTRLAGAWGELAEKGEASLRGETLATNLTFTAAALGHDTIKLDRLEMPCHLVETGGAIEVEKLAISCELGNVSLSGSAKMSDFSAADKVAALLHEDYHLTGEVDLVELARVLPETLHIRQGTEITSGNVRLSLASRRADDNMTWSGTIDASHLGAKADGKSLVWENPLALEFVARETKDGIVVDRAECTSSFLQANAAGSIDELTATARFDLARLVTELKQFADLSKLQMAGQGDAKLTLKRLPGDEFSAHGEFQTTGFQFVPVAGGEPWKENTVLARFDVDGTLQKQALKRIDSATMSVEVGAERLSAQLREPIADLTRAACAVQCAWRGNLADWKPRLDTFLDMSGWDIRGTGDLQAVLTCSSKSIQIEHAKANFAQLQIWGHEWFINEAAASVTAEGRVDLEKSRAEITEARLTSGTTTAVVRNAAAQATEEGWKVDGGTAQLGADLVTFYRWRHDPRQPAQWRVFGRLAAEADLKHAAGITTARVDGTIDQLKLVDLAHQAGAQGAGTWEEPRLTLAALCTYKHSAEQLQINNAQLASAALRVDALGTVPTSEQGGDLDVKGTVQYDWARLAPLWRPYLGTNVQIAGAQTRNFAVRGRLSGSPTASDSWRQMAGEASVGWTGMNLYGLQVGQGTIAAKLANGQVRTEPIDFQVSQGRFTFTPVARITPAPAELFIPRGPLLTDVHLTPEMCKRGLKFVAPIVAETAVAEGRFSVTMDGGRIPLADPAAGDLLGHMAIRAQVKPGPVAEEFLVLVNEILTVVRRGNFQPLNEQTGSLMSIDTADVEFRMVDRRVYHRNLKFVLGTLPITTHGSVGLDDESLSMVAEVPIRANLLGRDLSVGTLEGQTMQIPIGGTLSKPKIDRGVLRQFTGKLLENMTKGALFNEVNKQLERFIPLQK